MGIAKNVEQLWERHSLYDCWCNGLVVLQTVNVHAIAFVSAFEQLVEPFVKVIVGEDVAHTVSFRAISVVFGLCWSCVGTCVGTCVADCVSPVFPLQV
jgi:hypothetical protein